MNIYRRGLRCIMQTLARLRLISARQTSVWSHALYLNRLPDLKNPKDLNEKLIWLSFNTDTSVWSRLADKYEVRNYIKSKGLSEILVPIFGVYSDAEEIEFKELNAPFVIKSTNGSAQTIIVDDILSCDIYKIKNKIKSWTKRPIGLYTGEKHYLSIPPRILIERRLQSKTGELPVDYKFMCFDGKADSCLVCSQRNTQDFHCKLNLMNLSDWSQIEGAVLPSRLGDVEKLAKPELLDEMIRISEILSEGFNFVRVDLYEIDGKIYFGELTFTPNAARIDYFTQETLNLMGDKLKINNTI